MTPALLETGPRLPARERSIPWQQNLPTEWRTMVIAPLSFHIHREYEMAAERVQGLDEDERCCYLKHHVRQEDLRSDDDGELETVLHYGEIMSAWRLRDERWLIHRSIFWGEEEEGISFYSFSEHMPR